MLANFDDGFVGIIYASTSLPNPTGSALLTWAIQSFLATVEKHPPEILWSLHYTQQYTLPSLATAPTFSHTRSSIDSNQPTPSVKEDRIIQIPDQNPGLALEDSMLKNVRETWEKIVGEDIGEGFMVFEDREGLGEGGGDDDEEEEEEDFGAEYAE